MPHPKMLGFRALYFAVAYGIFFIFLFIIFKMLFFIFWPLSEKLLDCPKKIILPDSAHPIYAVIEL